MKFTIHLKIDFAGQRIMKASMEENITRGKSGFLADKAAFDGKRLNIPRGNLGTAY